MSAIKIGDRASVHVLKAQVDAATGSLVSMDRVARVLRVVLAEGWVRRAKRAQSPRVFVWTAPVVVPWTQRGRLTVARALAFIAERGQATRGEMRDKLRISDSRSRALIRAMRANAMIVEARRQRGSEPAIWRVVVPT